MILSISVCGTISLLAYFWRDNIAKIFTNDPDVIHLLNEALPILSMIFFVAGIGWPANATMEGI